MEDRRKVEDRRKLARHRTFKAGSIAFNRAGTIDCRVRNLSAIGACLEVASQLGIPDDFILLVESEQLKQHCHVIWRTDLRLGVAFTGSVGTEADEMEQAAAGAAPAHTG